jgi:hypothetical protein
MPPRVLPLLLAVGCRIRTPVDLPTPDEQPDPDRPVPTLPDSTELPDDGLPVPAFGPRPTA